jgi:Tetracyclin repressor-like, C-terminal domain/Bacterial regulatory proteins, tetR family
MARPSSAAATTEGADPVARRPGRKRDTALDGAILHAALGVLAELGFAGFTVNEVIARTGVSSATVYRRWATMEELIVAALQSLSPDPVDIDTGSLDGDLGELVCHLGTVLSRYGHLTGPGTLGSGSEPPFGDLVDEIFVRPRREALGQILRRAQGRGELVSIAPVADCWSYLAGPIHHRVFVRRKPFTKSFAAATTAFVIAGLRALCGPRE